MAALITTLSAIPAVEAHAQSEETVTQAQPSISQDDSFDLEASVNEILEANPGSTRVGDNDILLEPGLMWSLPSDGEVGAQALADCPAGWLCGWTNVDYAGGRMAVQQGDHEHFLTWYWDDTAPNYRVKQCRIINPCDLGSGDWQYLTNSISSVYNNTWSITWAPFYSPRNNANYYALRGAPARYVGAMWNDSFTEMCGCP